MNPRRLTLLALSLLTLPLLAGACATGGNFPSLLPRPVEQLSFEEPIRTDPAIAANPALQARAAALLAEARRGNGLFEAAYARALPQVRGAGPSGSDSWIEAQAAITRAEAAQRVTSVATGDLDALVTEQAQEPISADDHAALVQSRDAAAALADAQARRLDSLRGVISPG